MAILLNIFGPNAGAVAIVALSTGLSFFWILNAWYRRRKLLQFDIKPCAPSGETAHTDNQSLIIFYNPGLRLIRFSDFATDGPLQVNSDKKLFNAELLGTTDDYARIAFDETSTGFSITPEYLDRGDGFVLRVDHEKHAEFSVEGRIIRGRISRGRGIGFWYAVHFIIHLAVRLVIITGYIALCEWMNDMLSVRTPYGVPYWSAVAVWFTAAMVAAYLAITFDYGIGKLHSLVRRYFR